MLYPCIDFLQVLILEIRRILPSASSKQRAELLKTLHNNFQRKTTVMDYRLPWMGGRSRVKKQCGSTIRSFLFVSQVLSSFIFFPSLLSPLPPSPIFFPPFPFPNSFPFSFFFLSSLPPFLSFSLSSLPFPLSYLSQLIPTIVLYVQIKIIDARLTLDS